jgi:hypothetical protein
MKVSNCTTVSWMTIKGVKAISIVKFPSCSVTCAFSQSFVEPWCCKTLSEVLVVCMSKEVAALTQNYEGFKQRMLDEAAKKKASRSGSGRATGEC